MKKLLLFCLTIIISLPVWAASSYKFYFDGTETNREVFNATGIFVVGEAKQLVVVNNSIAHYYVGLPYSEKWVFDYEGGHLKGNAGPFNFDVQMWSGDETPEQHLQTIKEYLKSNAPVKDDAAEFIKFENETVLRSEIDLQKANPAFEGAKQLHFYSVRKSGRTLYKLHFSIVIAPDEAARVRADERKFLMLMTKGFTVYQR